MKKYTTSELRKRADTIKSETTLTQEVIRKYNLLNHSNPDGTQQPSGRAWIMWFLDCIDNGLA